MNRKLALLTASAALAVTLGGCAQNYPQPMAQVQYYYCPPGYYLASDNLCYLQAAPPPASYADTSPSDADPPASQPAPPPAASAPTWTHDLKTAGAGAAVGAVAGNQLAKRAATAAGEDATAGMMAGGAGAGAAEGAAATEATESAVVGAGELLEGSELGELLLEFGELLILIP